MHDEVHAAHRNGELLGVAIGFCQPLPEVIGDPGLGSLQIDDLIAIDNANAGAALSFERNDLHEFVLCEPSEGGNYNGCSSPAKAKSGNE